MHPSCPGSFLAIKLVLSSIGSFIPKKLESAGDGEGLVDRRYYFAFKDSVDAEPPFAAETNRLAPGEGAFEKEMLVVSSDEHVFNSIAQVVHGLHSVLPELSV